MAAETAELVLKTDGAGAEHPTNMPPDVEAELEALSRLNDDALWAVARCRMINSKQRRWRRLLEKNERGALTDPERHELMRLTADGDRLTLCKAHAYLLLQQRGYSFPGFDRFRG